MAKPMPLQGASIRGLWDAREVHTYSRQSRGHKRRRPWLLRRGKGEATGGFLDPILLSARAPRESSQHHRPNRKLPTENAHPHGPQYADNHLPSSLSRAATSTPCLRLGLHCAVKCMCTQRTPAARTSLHRMWHPVDLRRVKWHLPCVETLISVPSKPMLRSRRWKENSFNAGFFFF